MHKLDHFMIAANDLDRLSEYFTTITGVPAAAGVATPTWARVTSWSPPPPTSTWS